MEQQELSELIAENLRLTREMHGLLKAMHRAMIWGRVKFVVKLVILLGVLYVGYSTLPSLAERYLAPYQEIINKLPAISQQLQGISNLKIPPELKKLLPPSK